MALPFTWLDVFSAEPLSGNQLAVVHDADALADPVMLAFARETRLSETTFVQEATEPGADYRNRIWWSKGEMPFAGHPSLGTAAAVARRRGVREARYVQQTPAGLQPVEVAFSGEARARASMLQEPAAFGDELGAGPALAAAGLAAGDAHPTLPVQRVSTGIGQLLVPLRDERALGRCAPAPGELGRLLDATGAATLYVFWPRPDVGGGARARAFFDDRGRAAEDPATGSAAGPLCAYLHARTGSRRVIVEQGAEMGRPSRLEAGIEGDRVRVTGDVVVLATGHLHL